MAKEQHLGVAGQEPIFQGTAVNITFQMTPVTDVTGWTTLVSFKSRVIDGTFVKQYTPTLVAALTGRWSIAMTRADTLLFTVTPATYVYSLERIDAGNECVLTYGQFQVTRKVNS